MSSHLLRRGLLSSCNPASTSCRALGAKPPIDPYAVLNVKQTSTAKHIKSRYYQLSKQYHPDSSGATDENTAMFHSISEAYDILSNADKRAAFDRVNRTSPVSQGSNSYGAGRRPPPQSRPPSAGATNNSSYENADRTKWREEYEDVMKDPFTGKSTFDEGDWDRQYINFVRFQERLRKQQNKGERTKSYGPSGPNTDSKFESFYHEASKQQAQWQDAKYATYGFHSRSYGDRTQEKRGKSKQPLELTADDAAALWAQEHAANSKHRNSMPSFEYMLSKEDDAKKEEYARNAAFVGVIAGGSILLLALGHSFNAQSQRQT
jgi:curved DNA-binding protein CbpA